MTSDQTSQHTSELAVGDSFGPVDVTVTRADMVRYAGASGDLNPIHWSDRQARELGLDGVIAHGMWTMGRGLSVATDWLQSQGFTPDQISGYFVRFTRPVQVPDTADGITVSFGGSVASIADDTLVVSVDATCAGQGVLGAAKVEVRR